MKPSLSLILALFAAVFVLMKRFLRRNKRGKTSQTAAKPKQVMNEPVAGSRGQTNPEALRNAYDLEKVRLVADDPGLHWFDKAKSTATPDEIRAESIIFRIREDERDNLFGNVATEAIPGPETLDMGGQFLTNKDRILAQSKIFQISKQMPKGAHLHLHFNAELDPELLLTKSTEPAVENTMFIRSTQPLLSPKDYDETEIVFSVLPAETTRVDIWSPDYRPDFRSPGATPWMLWKDFRKVFRQKREGLDPDRWILDKMVLNEHEVYSMTQTTNG
jgi:adenosine deaminase CECR1